MRWLQTDFTIVQAVLAQLHDIENQTSTRSQQLVGLILCIIVFTFSTSAGAYTNCATDSCTNLTGTKND